MLPRHQAQKTDQRKNPEPLKWLSTAAMVAVLAAIALLAVTAFTPTTSQAAKKGGGGGGDPHEPTPAQATFRNDLDDNILGEDLLGPDDPDYVDGVPPELNVYVGSPGGNIFINQPNDKPQDIRLRVPSVDDPDCFPNGVPSLPQGEEFTLHYFIVDVDQSVDGGAPAIPLGDTQQAPAIVRFLDPSDGDAPYVLHFETGVNGACKNQSSEVNVTHNLDGTWTITNDGSGCIEKAKSKEVKKAFKCFSGSMDFSFDLATLP